MRTANFQGLEGWDLQMKLWGYAVQGEIIEPDACASEKPNEPTFRRWDLTISYLAECLVDRGRGWERAPYWYCLVNLPWDWRERAFAAHPPAHIDGPEAPTEGVG